MLRVRRPSPALVISLIALFASLSGGAYAAVSINGKSIKSRSITAKKIKKSTITGAEVGRNKLTSADIAESKLGRVPKAKRADSAATADHAATATSASNATHAASSTTASTATHATAATSADHATTADSATTATTATNAASVDGASVTPIYFRGAGTSTVLDVGGLTLEADCNTSVGTDLNLVARTTNDNASIRFSGYSTLTGHSVFENGNFDSGASPDLLAGGDNQVAGTLTYDARTPDAAPTGANVVTVTLRTDEIPAATACEVAGTAVSSRKPLP